MISVRFSPRPVRIAMRARRSKAASARDGQQKEEVPAGEAVIDIADASRLAVFVDHIERMKQQMSGQ